MDHRDVSEASSDSESASDIFSHLHDSASFFRRLNPQSFLGQEQSNPRRCTVCRYDREQSWPLSTRSESFLSFRPSIDLSELIEGHQDCKFCDVLFQGIRLFPNGQHVISAVQAVKEKQTPTTHHQTRREERKNETRNTTKKKTQPPWSIQEPKPPPSLSLR